VGARRLVVTHIVEAFVGGVRRHILDLLWGLPLERFEQRLICSVEREPSCRALLSELVYEGFDVLEVPMVRRISPLQDLHCLRQIRQLLREQPPDIVHTHSAKAGFLGRHAASQACSARIVHTPHVLPFQTRVSSLAVWMYRKLERYAGRRTDAMIALSEYQAGLMEWARLVPAERVRVIRNGIDPAAMQVEVDRNSLRSQLDIPPEAVVIIALGNLRPQKGYDTLVAAAPMVMEREPRACFLIAGAGEAADDIAAQIEAAELYPFVRMLGWREDVPELLAISDLFVMPSLWEGCPYALLEAMSAGVPVVASDIPGINDVIADGQSGWLTPSGRPDDLAATILVALGNDRASQSMAQEARQLVASDFSLDAMLEQTAALYEELAT